MTSSKQIDANRRNALKSTGPTTPQGKMRSRCNAVRHGLTAETVIAKLEDADDYKAFEAAVIADYDAESVVQRELVLRLASILWRLRRATMIETAVFESLAQKSNGDAIVNESPIQIGGTGQAQLYQSFRRYPQPIKATDEVMSDSKRDIGDYFLRLAALPTFPLDRLSRYECMLWRQARQIVFTLQSSRRHTRPQRRFPFSFRTVSR